MITLLALFIASHQTLEISKPSYIVNNCYEVSDPEARPGLIKITDIKKTEYEYQVLNSLNPEMKYLNDFNTIEYVYDRSVECPNT